MINRHQNSVFARILPLAALALLGGCNSALLDPQGRIGVDERNLILLSFFLMLLVVIPVIAMTIIFAVKYRASNRNAAYLPYWDYSHKIEMIVWGVPCLIVLALSIVCWKSTHDLDPAKPLVSNAAPLTIDVISLDWKWLFIYPDQHIASVNQLAFPVNVPVNFVITSASVMNSFFIPQLGSQIYAMAGMKEKLSLITDKVGTYDGLSANFSGAGFSHMQFKALAMNQAGFDQWVAQAAQSPAKLDDATYETFAAPGDDDQVHYFSAVDPNLFDTIVARYMTMPMGKPKEMNMGMNPPSEGESNVR